MTRTSHATSDPVAAGGSPGGAPGGARRRVGRLALATTLAAATLVLGACGGDDGEGAEDRGVDVELKDGGLSLGDDDDFFDVSTEDELPEGFPEDVPLPEEYTVTVSNRSTTSGGMRWDLGLDVAADPADVFEGLTAGFEGTDWSELDKATTEVQGRTVSAANYDDGERLVSVNVTSAEEGDGAAVFITVTPSGG